MENSFNINNLPDLTTADFNTPDSVKTEFFVMPDLDQAKVSDTELSAWEYTYAKQDHLSNLLHTSSYGSPYREAIECDINNINMGEDEYYALLTDLQSNQMDVISHMGNLYKKGDINKYLKRLR